MSCDRFRNAPILDCEVVFLSSAEGGRSRPPAELSNGQYRPHLVIGARDQRKALRRGREFLETYYGVLFCEGPTAPEANVPIRVRVALPFYPDEKYEQFVHDATFTIREGFEKVVGHGVVIRRSDPDGPSNSPLQPTPTAS